MKKIFLIFLITFSLLFTFSTSQQIALAQNEQIFVIGEGEICVTPDTAVICLGVETLNNDLSLAQTENSTQINNLIAILKEYEIPDNNIKTKAFNVYQKYDYSQGEKFVGYYVSTFIEFKTTALDDIGTIVNKLIENGANKFNGIIFTLENFDDAYNQALEIALNNAKNKAYSLFNGELNILKITEEKNNISYLKNSLGYVNTISEATQFMKGEIKINAMVSVIFENVQ